MTPTSPIHLSEEPTAPLERRQVPTDTLVTHAEARAQCAGMVARNG